MPFMAAGRLNSAQRALLGLILEKLGRKGLFRVVLIHTRLLPARRAGVDACATQKTDAPAQGDRRRTILHGHNHEQTLVELQPTTGPLFVVGVPSASDAMAGRTPAARYNECRIDRVDNGWFCEMIRHAVAD